MVFRCYTTATAVGALHLAAGLQAGKTVGCSRERPPLFSIQGHSWFCGTTAFTNSCSAAIQICTAYTNRIFLIFITFYIFLGCFSLWIYLLFVIYAVVSTNCFLRLGFILLSTLFVLELPILHRPSTSSTKTTAHFLRGCLGFSLAVVCSFASIALDQRLVLLFLFNLFVYFENNWYVPLPKAERRGFARFYPKHPPPSADNGLYNKNAGAKSLCSSMVTRRGIEPLLPPWKGGVLTAWPTGRNGSGKWTWTTDTSGMNRML